MKAPASPSAISRRVESLARDLSAAGLEVECWRGAGPRSAKALAERLSAGGFDLIHAHDDLVAGSLTRGQIPTVTTWYRAPTDPEGLLIEGLGDGIGLVRAFEGEPGAHRWRAAVASENEVATYTQVFAEFAAEHAAHRVNAVHDERPWGAYWVLDDQPAFKVKRIRVKPGKRLSYQRHAHRAEHWFVVQGRALVTLDGVDHELAPGQAIDIAAGQAHRIANVGDEEMTFVEIQSGSYFGEDDIERLDDDFGRAH